MLGEEICDLPELSGNRHRKAHGNELTSLLHDLRGTKRIYAVVKVRIWRVNHFREMECHRIIIECLFWFVN
jgi:hypothetical protein